jgi:hypothetical protein
LVGWAGASWLFFRIARSTRMTKIWALGSRLEKQPTDLRQNTSYFGDRTLKEALNELRSTSIHQSTHSGDALLIATDQIPQWLSRLIAESFN